MSDFRMPDSYYDPPEYDGCEDCECEDPEWPERGTCHCEPDLMAGMCDCEDVCDCKCHNISYPPED